MCGSKLTNSNENKAPEQKQFLNLRKNAHVLIAEVCFDKMQDLFQKCICYRNVDQMSDMLL